MCLPGRSSYDHLPCPASTPNLIGTRTFLRSVNKPLDQCQAPNQPKVQRRFACRSMVHRPCSLVYGLKTGPEESRPNEAQRLEPPVRRAPLLHYPANRAAHVDRAATRQQHGSIDPDREYHRQRWGVRGRFCQVPGGGGGLRYLGLICLSSVRLHLAGLSLDDIYQTFLTENCDGSDPFHQCDFNLYFALANDASYNFAQDITVVDAGGCFRLSSRTFFPPPRPPFRPAAVTLSSPGLSTTPKRSISTTAAAT